MVYTIVNFSNNRFAIADENNCIIDDAQGYGYKTWQSAKRAAVWKYDGGKEKLKNQKQQYLNWVKEDSNATIVKEINDTFELNWKELSRNEVTVDDIFNSIEQKFNIKLPSFVKKQILK